MHLYSYPLKVYVWKGKCQRWGMKIFIFIRYYQIDLQSACANLQATVMDKHSLFHISLSKQAWLVDWEINKGYPDIDL